MLAQLVTQSSQLRQNEYGVGWIWLWLEAWWQLGAKEGPQDFGGLILASLGGFSDFEPSPVIHPIENQPIRKCTPIQWKGEFLARAMFLYREVIISFGHNIHPVMHTSGTFDGAGGTETPLSWMRNVNHPRGSRGKMVGCILMHRLVFLHGWWVFPSFE